MYKIFSRIEYRLKLNSDYSLTRIIVKLAIGFSDGAEGKSTFRSRLSVSEGNPKQIIFHNQGGRAFM